MATRTKVELEKRIAELEGANEKFAAKNAQLAIHMREAVHNGDRWRRQFWMLMEMMEVYTKHNPRGVDKTNGDPIAQAKMIASIDPENKKWSIFWEPTE